MPVLGAVELLIQIYFAVHAGRTGRYWWIFPIMGMPLIGVIIYFFVEYLPDLQTDAKIRSSFKPTRKSQNIKQLQRELELTDSIKNRINLAEAYFHHGYFKASIDLLEESLNGVNGADLHIIEGLSLAHFFNGSYENSLEYLNKYENLNNNELKHNLRLIKAEAYEKKGDVEAALKEYDKITDICHGEEARCKYALLLKQQGHADKAKALFDAILNNARLYPKHYAKTEKQWVKIARAEKR